MSYTTPTPYFETATTPASTHDAGKEIAVWLNGTHATQSNAAPWECIDCYDGTTREQPASGSFDNLTASNKWREDQAALPTGAWAVFQAPSGGAVVNRYQFYIEMSSSSRITIGIIMLNDWTIGGGTPASPTIPATALGVPGGTAGVDGVFANHTDFLWRVIADEGSMWISAFPTVAGAPEFVYLGDLVPYNPASADPRPFVISRNPDALGWGNTTAAQFKYISILDDTTVIDVKVEVEQHDAMTAGNDQDALTSRSLSGASAVADSVGERYIKGEFRLAGAAATSTRGSDETERITAGDGPTTYDFEIWGRNSSFPQIVTRYPPGTALDSHVQVSDNSIPPAIED